MAQHTCSKCGDSFPDSVTFCPKDGTRLAARAPADLVGTLIADRYRITKKLGGGGMGDVYLAEHVRIKSRLCAVKVLRSNLAGDAAALQRFEREAENASLLSHPNVAQVYDFGEHGDLVYLAMEFIEGESLAELLKREPVMHPDVVADIILQSASALDAAHARQVLHRDVKPDNIMLARNADGTYLAKLVDFGIARAMASEDQRVTQTGFVIGTPEYMSPEQIAGETLDLRSDLYALALVAFQALTGQSAFPNTSSMESLIARLTSRPRTLLEALQSVEWPQSVQDTFDKALAPQRDERHGSAGEFAAELANAIGMMSPTETAAFYRKALESRPMGLSFPTQTPTPGRAVQRTPSYSRPQSATPAATRQQPTNVQAPPPMPTAMPTSRMTMPMPTPTPTPVVGPWTTEPVRAARRRRWSPRILFSGIRRLASYAFIAFLVYAVVRGKTGFYIRQVEGFVEPLIDKIRGVRVETPSVVVPVPDSTAVAKPPAKRNNRPKGAAQPNSDSGKSENPEAKSEVKADAKAEPKTEVKPPADTVKPPIKSTPPDTGVLRL